MNKCGLIVICQILHSLEREFFVHMLMETIPNQPRFWPKRILKYFLKNKSLSRSFSEHELLMSEIIIGRSQKLESLGN